MIGSAALYIVGNLLFKYSVTSIWALSHMIGLGLLALTIPLAAHVSPLLLSAAAAGILIVVAILEIRFSQIRVAR